MTWIRKVFSLHRDKNFTTSQRTRAFIFAENTSVLGTISADATSNGIGELDDVIRFEKDAHGPMVCAIPPWPVDIDSLEAPTVAIGL